MDAAPLVEDPSDLDEETGRFAVPEASKCAEGIAAFDNRWKAGQPLQLGNRRWQPNLIRKVGKRTALLHVHLADRLRSYALERMVLAFEAGIEVHIALPLSQLYNEKLLCGLIEVDPLIHIVNEPLVKRPPRLLAVLADLQITVSRDARRSLGRSGHAISQRAGTASEKGKRLEALLAFLLSQVEDFIVIERNFRTRTGEIDLVVQQRATTGRLWATIGAPLILVEAKNRAKPVSQPMVSVFRTKMQTSRGGVRLGIMVAAAAITEDASLQELKFASENLTIAFITKPELEAWIGATNPDEWLERHFSRAMLR